MNETELGAAITDISIFYSPAKTKPKPTENNRAFCKTDSGLEVRPAMLC